MKLYEIANDFAHVISLAESGELDADTVRDTLESITGAFEDKARNCMMIVRQIEAEADGIKKEIDRLKALHDQSEKQAQHLKDYIKTGMETIGKDKIDLGLFKLTLKAPTKAVEVVDAAQIPADYWRVVPETKAVDKSLIATMLKLGKEIAGAKLVDGKRALLIK